MENLLNILNILNSQSKETKHNESQQSNIPKEIYDQYPYGDFPSRYTKIGQENIRKQSENRYSYESPPHSIEKETKSEELNISSLLPLIQLLSNKKQPIDTMQILSQLLFKDNKDLQKIFSIITKQKPKEIEKESEIPNLNKVSINSLKRIDE